MMVLEFPPSESLMSMVSGWLRYGQCFDPLVSALMTSPIALGARVTEGDDYLVAWSVEWGFRLDVE